MSSKTMRGALVALVLVATGWGGDARGQDEMDPDAAMQQYMEMMAPGEEHEALQAFVGTWDVAVKSWWQGPDGPATESSGVSEGEWILDGRYLEENVTGQMGMGVFRGIGIVGFDKFNKEYVNSWVDNMGTGIFTATGVYDPAEKTYTYTGTMDDPMTGREDVPFRSVIKIESDDKHVHESFEERDGEWVKTMELIYTRKG
ncbi:MAG: DUF1579 domain-containing protein [Candidatus Eisenbacteria bacterium]|nr:DUF1579 domain-containing protein [Candidatus Latescibacterota bacterium]MBD3303488.1 DUF1579 domain-containing protein [Candidatus Eisenbacteria bacterium]